MEARHWEPSPEVRFRWKRARQSLIACRRLVFLDLGNGAILRIGRFAPASEMTGALYTRASVENWLRDGAQWERVILPCAVPHSQYDPPYREQERTPDAWRARQEHVRRWVFGADIPQP
jgi:hypothetical protein